MSISLYSHNTDQGREIPFGHDGLKKVMQNGEVVCIVTPDGKRISKEVTRVELRRPRRDKSDRSTGLGDIPFGTQGVVIGFDTSTRTDKVLRVVFSSKHLAHTTRSISLDEIKILQS